MINVTQEKLLKMSDVAQLFGVQLRTVYGWANRQRGNRLETIKVGGKRMTSEPALIRFTGQPVTQQPAANDRQHGGGYEAAMKQLRALNGVA